MTTGGFLRLTLATLIGVGFLVGLGLWQLKRLEWKEGLIARIEARTERNPMSLERALELAEQRQNPSYFPVHVTGRFHHKRERYLYGFSLDGEPGWHVITPLETVGGQVVLVDRGFVPDRLRDPATRPEGQVQEVVGVTGLLRTSEEPSVFIPDNDPVKNQWFSRDLLTMSRSMFPGGTVQVAPFFLEADATPVPGGWPKGGQTRLTLVNNHLQYALTWFGLAICLVAVYVVFLWGAYRGEKS
jgi:surfeit locus 1 family protein